MRITTFDNKKRQEVLVGMYDGKTKTLTKTVGKDHYMLKEKGYGIQSDVLGKLHQLGCETVLLHTATQTLEYPFALLLTKKGRDYGHGAQIFLTVPEAKVIRKPITQPSWLRKG